MNRKQAFNPYLPSWEYVPDGEPRIFGDRLYIFGSHDLFNGKDFCLNDYVCWSAPLDDLADWRYEGVMYRAEQDPNYKDNYTLCAPDVVQGPDGRFYLYYEFQMLTVTSVAVSNTPAGPYAYYGDIHTANGRPYGTVKGQVNLFDPAVLVDDDGRVFMYSGFSPLPGIMRTMMGMRGLKLDGGYCIELEQDMLTVRSDAVRVLPGHEITAGTGFEGHGYFEASSIRKIGSTYYLVYSSELSHELCYATSDRPNGGFCYGGTIISIGDIGYQGNTKPVNYTGNTHGGMVEVKGQWYIFYHRQTNKQKCCRQGCAEKITILPDGSIPQVEMTSCGLNDGPLKGSGYYEARICCTLRSAEGTFPYLKAHENDKKGIHPFLTQSGGDREDNGDQYIANMTNGAQAGFKAFKLENLREITVKVRGSGKGWLRVSTEPKGEDIAMIPVWESAEWVKSKTALQTPISGIKALYFTFCGTGAVDFTSFELIGE